MMYNGVQCEFPPGYDGTVLLERLQPILDPELDESILQLGFIQSLHVHDGHATIVVQLPTSWCAANFAYMMADDIRRALLTVEGIHHVTVRLQDHFAAEAIETAVNAGKPFAEAFPGEGCGSLSALRVTFLHKGFTSRQERLLRALRAVGFLPEDICALRVGDVVVQGDACVVQRASRAPREIGAAETLCRYLARRAELGFDCAAPAPFMIDLRGHPLTVERLEAYYQAARTVRVSLEANGVFCRTLLTVSQPNAGERTR
jgi:metal-sulfur cluster biosynthetic enzyme